MSRKPLLGLDLDGCLYRWTEAALATVHALRGREVPEYGEDQHWNHIKEALTDEEWHWLWNDREARKYCFGTGRAYADGVLAAQKLDKLYDVVIVTSRPADVVHVTSSWLARHRVPYHSLVITAGPNKKDEHPFVQHCDLFVDDNPENCLAIADLGIPVYAPARAYNRVLEQYSGAGRFAIHRFNDWEEVIGA